MRLRKEYRLNAGKIFDPVKKHRKFILLLLFATLLYTCVAIVLTYPLVFNLSSHYFSPELGSSSASGDGIGTIADIWQANNPREQGATKKLKPLIESPVESDSRGITYPLSSGMALALARLTGAQASFNILMLLSFPLAGAIMFLLVFYVTRNGAASILGGFLYAFSPWHTSRAYDHLSLTAVHCLPLFVLAMVVFWKRKDLISAIALALAGIIAFLTDLHLGLFCALMSFTWLVALYVSYRAHGRKSPPFPSSRRKTNLKVALLVLLAIIIAAAVVVPVYRNLFYKDPAAAPGAGGRGIDETVAYSAHPADYIIPPAHALVWRSFIDSVVANRTEKALTSNEVTMYPGIVTFILAAYALVKTFRRRKRRKGKGDSGMDTAEQASIACSEAHADPGQRYVMDTVVYFAGITAVAAFILSMPPLVKLGGVELPTPSIIIRSFAPMFRFYCRWGLVVTFALTLLAGIGFTILAKSRKWNLRWTVVACALLLVLFCVDVTIIPPRRSRDISKPPKVISELSRFPQDQPVAIYPLYPGIYSIPLWYRYYLQFHLHPMLSGITTGTEADLYLMVMNDIYAPYTPRMLSGIGIEKVVILNSFYKMAFPSREFFDPGKMPPGYRMVKKTKDGYIYDITAPPAQVFPLFYMNFTVPRLQPDGMAWTAMVRPTAEILLVNKGGHSTWEFSITVYNPGEADTLDVALDGKTVGGQQVPPGIGQVTVPMLELTKKRHILTLKWKGRSVRIEKEVIGTDSPIDAYLLFSRPEFNRASP